MKKSTMRPSDLGIEAGDLFEITGYTTADGVPVTISFPRMSFDRDDQRNQHERWVTVTLPLDGDPAKQPRTPHVWNEREELPIGEYWANELTEQILDSISEKWAPKTCKCRKCGQTMFAANSGRLTSNDKYREFPYDDTQCGNCDHNGEHAAMLNKHLEDDLAAVRKGFTYATECLITPNNGHAYDIVLYTRGKPTPADIAKTMAKSRKKDDHFTRLLPREEDFAGDAVARTKGHEYANVIEFAGPALGGDDFRHVVYSAEPLTEEQAKKYLKRKSDFRRVESRRL